ncbi:hypothetical protein OHN99_02590 [Streptomyces jietaisiensis]|uniref:Uncharacterized protein n=1 Tax=Streptomyces griseoaurantiacus TaxID=68213 RepID=A0ABZ1UY63_9ACTN
MWSPPEAPSSVREARGLGAEGARSRVRPAVSSASPRHTGVTAVETSLDDIDTRHPGPARLIGDGSVAVYGVNRGIVAQRNGGGHVKGYAPFRAPLDRPAHPDQADGEAVRASLLPLFEGWASPVLDLLRQTPPSPAAPCTSSRRRTPGPMLRG